MKLKKITFIILPFKVKAKNNESDHSKPGAVSIVAF